jgi:hypothetical protein
MFLVIILFVGVSSIQKAACYAACAAMWWASGDTKNRCHNDCYGRYGPGNANGCFSIDNTFEVLEEGKLVVRNVSEIRSGDLLVSSRFGNKSRSSVLFNEKSIGDFEFFRVEILVEKGKQKSFEITGNHGLIVKRNSDDEIIILPRSLKKGDRVFTDEGEGLVISISISRKSEKFTLVTKKGIAFACGVLVSTICDDSFEDGMKLSLVLAKWKSEINIKMNKIK